MTRGARATLRTHRSRHDASHAPVTKRCDTRAASSQEARMIYPELFKQLEAVRWSLDELPWASFDPHLLTHEQAQTVKMNAITEWAALPATEMFLRDNRHDSDFSAFISVWF